MPMETSEEEMENDCQDLILDDGGGGGGGLTGKSNPDFDLEEDQDSGPASVATLAGNRGYHNLETFQRKKLKQKVR